jgi:hypothetical protein
MREKKRSPLRTRPLPAPGQSLSRQLDELLYGKIMPWMIVGVTLIIFAVLEWMDWFFESPPHPVMATATALLGCLFIAWRVKKQIPLVKQMAQGVDGEKVVGQRLEQLRTLGYEVFHDIVGNGHNIDHAIVGPGGVFSIETKTISKPARGNPTVVFDGESIRVNGLKPDRDPIGQAKAEAHELARIIRDNNGPKINVLPVVLYPGWFVEAKKSTAVLVLNDKFFIDYIKHEPAKLSPADINQIRTVIEMHSRHASEKQ